MKKVLSFILCLCLSFSLLVPFSFSVSALSPTDPSDLTQQQIDYLSNNFRHEARYSFVYYNSGTGNMGVYYPDELNFTYFSVHYSFTSGNAFAVDKSGIVTTLPAGSGSFDLNAYDFFYLKIDSHVYINSLFKIVKADFIDLSSPQFELLDVFYVPDDFSIKIQNGLIQSASSSYVDFPTQSGNVSCSYNEANSTISCGFSSNSYRVDDHFTFNVNLNGSVDVNTSTVYLYKKSQRVFFDTYYTGWFNMSGITDTSVFVDGGYRVNSENKIYFVDTSYVEFSKTYTTSSPLFSVDSFISLPSYWNMYQSREYFDAFDSLVKIGYNVLSQLDLFTDGYDDLVQGTDDLKGTNQELENNLNDYNQIEGDIQTDFDEALNKVDTNPGLFNLQDFASTAKWVSVQLTNLYNSHDSIKYATGFALIFGLSLMIIGRRWR